MRRTLSTILAAGTGLMLFGADSLVEQSSSEIKPRFNAEHRIPIPNYMVTVRTFDTEPDGNVDWVRLAYLANDYSKSFNPPIPTYVADDKQPGYNADFSRIMTPDQRVIFCI